MSAPFGSAFYHRLRETYGFEIEDISDDPVVLSAREVSGWATGNWSRIYTDEKTGDATVATSVHVMRMVRQRLRGASAHRSVSSTTATSSCRKNGSSGNTSARM